MTITSSLFEAYLKCPTKCWLRAAGEPAIENTYAEWVKAENDSYRTNETARLIAASLPDEVVFSPNLDNVKAATWRFASNLAVQTQMDSCTMESELHLVERVPSGGQSKPVQFIPIRFACFNKVAKDDKLLLAFDTVALSKALKRETSLGKIKHGDNHNTLKVKTRALVGEVRKRLQKVTALLAGPTPPDLVLNRHCAECEFKIRCRKEAQEHDDLSLLAGMSAKERQTLRSRGVFTVTQLSYLFRPRRTPKRAKNPARPRYLALQALALRENPVYIHGTPTLPQSKTRVYLDIEGLPDRDFHYLIGILVVSEEHETFQSFWADTQADESAIFAQFVDTIVQLEDFRVFHFGDYDSAVLKRIRPRLSESHQKHLDVILGKCANVLSALYPHVYFPAYSNSLKDIGEHLRGGPPSPRATGLESIVWRTQWERGADDNLTDCITLKELTDFIVLQTSLESSGETSRAKVSHTEKLNSARPRWRMFTHRDYALKDFADVTKCSYFDYQREKVLIRTDVQLRKVNKRRRKLRRTKACANKIIDLQLKKCVVCGSRRVTPGRVCERWLFDLRFSQSGVKRWITKTKFYTYYCSKCARQRNTWAGEPRPSKYGLSLVSWCIYWHVIGGLNMRRVNRSLGDFFGMFIPYCESHRFKADIKAVYDPLYSEIFNALLCSPILHIDETRVNLRGSSGYVWVLASTDKVYFFYRPSREGDFLEEMLAPFQGILISDFFTAYDSLPCRQQKCVAHLVRDIDEDLFRNPLDLELRTVAHDFGTLLKSIVTTIDRFGLKSRYLQKHKREVRSFLEAIATVDFNSELVNKYKKRFDKGGEKMFTFLDNDGVPWNNNNAEHAIKFFAKFRQHADGRFTENSLRDYLVLASVFATCEFNNLNPLQFLLSKETTLSGLLRMSGRGTGHQT